MRVLLIVLISLAIAFPVLAQNTPTPTPPIQIPGADVIQSIQEADQTLAGAQENLNAPNGETGALMFSYVKWLISNTGAAELFGPFEGVITHLGVGLGVLIALFGVYAIIYLGIYLLKFAIWLIKLILAILQAIASIISAGANVAKGAIGGLLGFLGL